MFLEKFIWQVLRAPVFDGVRPHIIRSDGYLLVGKTSWCESFVTFVAGSMGSVEYFSRLFYVGAPRVESLGRVALCQICSCAESFSADLVVVESNWFFSSFLRDNGFFVSPRLDFVLKIEGSSEVIPDKAARDKKRRLEQVAAVGFTFEVTRDPAKLDVFYNELYLPHMLKRHAGCALPISLSECRKLFSKGELLLVKSGSSLISGNLLVPYERELHSPVVGVTDIEKNLTLGSYAAYYFSILVGLQRGFARMDFGEAPPFMSDGLFQFKKGLGMWVRPARGDSAQVFGVKIYHLKKSVSNFLFKNAFVFMEGERLNGLVFLDHVNVDSIKPFCVPGLSSLYVVSSMIPNLVDYKIEVLPLKSSLHSMAPVMRSLSQMCAEENYFISRIIY